MCLRLSENPAKDKKNFKRRLKEPLIAYKIVNSDMISGFWNFRWQIGLNISNRKSSRLTSEETRTRGVQEGFHLALEKPEECPYPYLCPYPHRHRYRYRCRYLCRCRCRYHYNKVLKCEIDPKDIVAIDIWEGIQSIVATKVTVLEEE